MPMLVLARQSVANIEGAEDAEFSGERLVNMLAQPWPDNAMSQMLIKQTEGLTSFATLGTDRPVRALLRSGSSVYAISGGKLFSVNSAGTVTTLNSSLLDAVNTSMFVNDNGEIGIAAGGVYSVWDISGASMSTPSMNALTGVQHVAYLGQYGILADTASDRFQITGLNNATSLSATDFSSADDSPDGIISIAAYGGYLWILGEDTIEIWRNTGAATFPFQRVTGATLERGCFGVRTVETSDNSVWLVGADKIVYRLLGGALRRVSTHAVERTLQNYENGDDIFAMTWTEGGHKLYGLRFPDRPAWVYDMSTNLWHERCSDVFGTGVWRVNSAVRAFGAEIMGSADGTLYKSSPSAYREGSVSICRIAESAPVVSDGKEFALCDLELVCKTGYVDIDRDAQVMMQISRDGKIYSQESWRSLGDLGDYTRRITWRGSLGRASRHQVRFKVTDPIPFSIYGAAFEATA